MHRIKARFVKCKDTPILEYFSPAFGRGSERAGSSHSESCEGRTLQPSREGREAAGRGLEAARGKGGKTGELQAREEPAWEAQSGCFVRPGVCRWAVSQSPKSVHPAPQWAGPGSGGAGAGPGSPRRGRGRTRVLRAGVGPAGRRERPEPRPPRGATPHWPRLPGCGRPIRAAFTGGWAEPAQLLRGSGMVTSPRGGGGARGGPTAPPAAQAGAGGAERSRGVPGTPGEGEEHEGLGRGAREGGWGGDLGRRGGGGHDGGWRGGGEGGVEGSESCGTG